MAGSAVLIILLCGIMPCRCTAYSQHRVYFQNSDYELHVYRIQGVEPGKTLLVIGGIQGNEPGGYLAADMYVEMSLKKGNLIVVPRANFYSILHNVRGINGDMNRKFGGAGQKSWEDWDALIIEKLKELIEESDFLLNLHDGSGFYADTWISDLRNPKRYGQSIIADCAVFYSKKYNKTFDMADIARKICTRVNPQIDNEKHHFHFNNHNTSDPETRHPEQRKSATYFAVTQHQIPAFGIETSKNISSPRLRVRYQTMVINAFMEHFDIIPENPRIALPDPEMKYLIAAVDADAPVLVYNEEPLYINKGSSVSVIHVETNYERGITANILGVGSYNDMRKNHRIYSETDIIIKKDNIRCGSVPIRFKPASIVSNQNNIVAGPDVHYLIVQLNDKRIALRPGEKVTISRKDTLIIQDVVANPWRDERFTVNFKGFVGNRMNNDGEDRGYKISPAHDHLMVKYSLEKQGKIYPIVVSFGKQTVATFYVSIADRPS